jgi:hypothetical protein
MQRLNAVLGDVRWPDQVQQLARWLNPVAASPAAPRETVAAVVETGQRADGQFKVPRLTSDLSFAAEFQAERDLIGERSPA